MSNSISLLPPKIDLEKLSIQKKLTSAHRFLAELKGISAVIPNQAILINTLSLQEAKDSSAIENIITTHDELYKEELFPNFGINPASKEVRDYAVAIRRGYTLIKKEKLLNNRIIQEIQSILVKNDAGFRKLPVTALKNDQTGELVYTPPQEHSEIIRLMDNLEQFINLEDFYDADPLVKMAILHYQFESIHPFYDGNGRTGRIINVLFLVLKDLLNIPILYLSGYIVRTKNEYYRLLQSVREFNDWESWILYILDGVEQTSKQTITIVQKITEAVSDYRHRIKSDYNFYSQDLINALFFHPYTKIEFLKSSLNISRLTATRYLDTLSSDGFLTKKKLGRSNYYINIALFQILSASGS